MTISFDEWSELYKTDRATFEQRRIEEIEAVISSAPIEFQHKLRQLQWKLDAMHSTMPPLKATIEMSKLMWESFEKLREQLNACASATEAPVEPKRSHLKLVVDNTSAK